MIGDRDRTGREKKKVAAAITLIPQVEGRPAGKALFKEFNPDADISIKEVHDEFVRIGDLTEYKAALAIVGSWERWEQIKTRWKAFPEIIDTWKNEIKVRLMSEAQEKILGIMREGTDTTRLNAAKWIAEQGFSATRRRPSEADKAKERQLLAKEAKIPDNDMERIEQMLEMRQ